MSSNLPPGVSESDPMAPWNQPDGDIIKCPHCYGDGFEPDAYNLKDEPDPPCHVCKGTGEVEVEPEDDGDEKQAARREPDWPGN